ncbi:MAG: hypothetical protein AB1456_10520 [Thermodesulfobacteriota bacterium]
MPYAPMRPMTLCDSPSKKVSGTLSVLARAGQTKALRRTIRHHGD